MSFWIVLALVFLLCAIFLPRILPSCVALASFILCLNIAYEFFGFWCAVIVGIITVTAIIYFSRKILAFLEKHPELTTRKKD